MIRNDFVSNSSSCSFVISNHESIKDALHNKKYDFLKFISLIPHKCRYSYDNGSIEFRKNGPECWDNYLLYQIPETSAIKITTDSPNNIEIKDVECFKEPEKLSNNDLEIITRLVEESDKIVFNLGLDDTGEKAPTAATILALLCYMYDVAVDSEEFNIDPIVNTTKLFKGRGNNDDSK